MITKQRIRVFLETHSRISIIHFDVKNHVPDAVSLHSFFLKKHLSKLREEEEKEKRGGNY